jgi:Protein of unknown function (DUF3108)
MISAPRIKSIDFGYKRAFHALAALVLSFCLTSSQSTDTLRPMQNRAFSTGEEVEYRVHYGFITAGEAVMRVDRNFQSYKGRPCFKMEIQGRSTGAFDKVLKIRDTWGCNFDSAYYVPQKSWRYIEEGNYKRREEVVFNQKAKEASLYTNDEKPKELKLPGIVYDMVGGYYFLRLLDYDNMEVGQIITLNAMLEDKLYNFKIRYRGKERIRTKMGKMNAIYLAPIMPPNQLFEGENSIQFYISDDANRIPVKIRAELFVGAVELDIKGFNNLRNPTKFER